MRSAGAITRTAKVEPLTDLIHGIPVTDPYRWLEDQNSTETRTWLEKQYARTYEYFGSLSVRQNIRRRVSELLSIPVLAAPWNVGDRYFFLQRQNGAEHPSIVERDGLFGFDTVLVDPAHFSSEASTAIEIEAISHDGRFLAYSLRHRGTDHAELQVLDVETKTILPDRLPDGFCSGFAFALDGSGFYYSHRTLHDERPNYRAVFWHRFGTNLSDDREVFFAGEAPNLFLGIFDSANKNILAYAVLETGKEWSTSIYLHDFSLSSRPRQIISRLGARLVPFFVGHELFACTNFHAPNYRIVRIDANDPEPVRWPNVIPESGQRIQQFAVSGDTIFIVRTDRFSSRIETLRLRDGRQGEIVVPPHGTVTLLSRTCATGRLFYSYSSITSSPAIYCYDATNNELALWRKPAISLDNNDVIVEEGSYPSKDGTSVPVVLAYKKDVASNGPRPTFLTGYGGFGSCVTPQFTVFATFLIEAGVLFAVPAIRGGSELGEQWHLAGKRGKRQNSFDDFIAAAEWLVSERRSARAQIAIGGGSNAGLLVGAAITQRPDLFRAAICLGPLLDMVRYHLFDFAATWVDEFGSPDDAEDFHSLYAYSPYHRVQDGVAYPAVLFVSGDADTRCNPMHARKMAARLQAANSSQHPILLDYKANWGHTPVQPLSKKIEALTDRLAFLCHELGISVD